GRGGTIGIGSPLENAAPPESAPVATPNAPPAASMATMPDRGSGGGARAPIDPEIAALFAARHKRIATLSVDGPRMLEARNYRQAAELCRDWADLELGNANAWRCMGTALQGLGNH